MGLRRRSAVARKREEGARSSAVEHYLDTVGVTGSIPVAPTIFAPDTLVEFGDRPDNPGAGFPLREWAPGRYVA